MRTGACYRTIWLTALALLALCARGAAAQELDPSDPTERVLLLLPQAPLLVELSLTIDEQPFRQATEKYLTALLADADTDKNGQVTWDEVKRSRTLPGAALLDAAAYDQNKNGVVDPAEARRAFAQVSGSSFVVQGQAFLGGPDGSQLLELLDSDGDGGLSDEEIDAAALKLRSRDADDNDIVTPQEIVGYSDNTFQGNARTMAAVETILPVAADTNFELLHATVLARYGRQKKLSPEAFKLTRAWAKRLDTNGDGELSAAEFTALRTVTAPLILDVALGTRTRLRDTVRVAGIDDELKRIARIDRGADGKLILDLLSIQIEVLAPNPKPTPRTFAGQAMSYLANLDRDKNQYLEMSELPPMLASQFNAWDLDGDGKVFGKELQTALERADAPNWQKISVAAFRQGNNLMTHLDEDADQRLGVREVRNAAERLRSATFDEEQTLRLAIARGTETYRYLSKGTKRTFRRGYPGAADSADAAMPGSEWFTAMDTNADGDVTAREFLGTAEQFQSLDANGDGILEASEVK